FPPAYLQRCPSEKHGHRAGPGCAPRGTCRSTRPSLHVIQALPEAGAAPPQSPCRGSSAQPRGTSRSIVLGMSETRQYLLERIDDAAVIQIYADGFNALPLRDKILVWHLYLAALAGRDIFYDQRHALNVEIRDVLEAILRHG